MAVFPRRLRSSVGVDRMTDGRCWDALRSGELAPAPFPSFLVPTLREIVNLVGSFPSLRSRSGRSRRRALMNQLQIWGKGGKIFELQKPRRLNRPK